MKSATRSLLSVAAPVALLSSLFCAAQTIPANPASTQKLNHAVQTTYGKLPLEFEANQGQTDPRVKFLAHGPGYSVFLTSGQMVLSLRSSAATANAAHNSGVSRQTAADTVIEINLVGANPNPAATGEDLQPGRVNYFIGKDPKRWQTNVPIYRQVRYKNIYPGIDLVYYGNQSRAEHDFVISPGTDPSQIQLEVKGADRLSIAANGDLMLFKGADEVRLQAPVVYQEFHGLRVPITGTYTLQNSTRVSFTLSQYDKTMPLVIDPVLVYGTFLGGLANDLAIGISVDSVGSAYVVGSTQSTNFPLAGQAGPPPSGTNVFVAKLDVSGSSLVYADYVGGNSEDYPTAMVMDGSNDVFITGYTYSGDYPTVNPYQANPAGGLEGFVTEVASDGASLVYSTYLGGSSYDFPSGIALDPTGDIFVAGSTYSQDFPVANAFQSTVLPNQNDYYGQYGFLAKLTPDGSTLAYSTYFGGSQNIVQSCNGQPCWPSPQSTISGLAVDGAGNAYVAGATNTYDFPVTKSAYQNSNTTTYDQQVGFVGKFDSSGNLGYSTYFEAVPENNYYFGMNAIAVDTAGSAYVAGISYSSGALPLTTPNLCDPTLFGCSIGFITKFDPTGSSLAYSTYLAANIDAYPQSLRVDVSGDAYVVSQSGGGDSSQLVNPIEVFTNQTDVLVQEIDPTGGTQLFSTFLGGYGYDVPAGIALDSAAAIYVTGYTNSTDYPVTAAALQNTLGGNYDAFVTKIGTAVAPAVSISPSLVQFSIRPVGSVSQPNTSLLRNMGGAALTVSKLTTTGDFAVDNNCGASVPAADTCTFTVTFSPTLPGPRFGSIMIEDDGAGSPHFINLVGNGATAVADLAPVSLSFPSLQINQTSSAQTATLTNNGNATLVISAIAITGDYAETDNCPSSLGIGSSCTFQVTFTPTAGGARNGTLSITDNAPGSPHTVSLSGSGYVTTATVAPSSLAFGNQTLGTTSAAQSITVTNTGANPILVSAVAATGDFAETDNCTTAPVAVSCTINVTFSPTVGGSRSGTLTISDDAQGNPHTVILGGTGLAGIAQLSASSLTFTALTVGTASSAQTVTITNSGNGTLTVTNVSATGDFAQTNNCTSVAANGATCAIQVTFTPTSSGSRTGTLTVTDSAANSPQLISLSGSGIDFSMPSSGGSASVKAGANATYQVSIGPVGGTFSSAVTLVCAGVPAFSTCTLSPTSVTPGAIAASVTVSIKTTGTAAQLSSPGAARGPVVAWLVLAPGFGLFGLFVVGTQPKQKGRVRHAGLFLLLIVLVAAMLFLPGCGGVSTSTPPPKGNATPPGVYTVLVIGTSGSVQHFTSLTLTVQ